jgi:hypothetical protein
VAEKISQKLLTTGKPEITLTKYMPSSLLSRPCFIVTGRKKHVLNIARASKNFKSATALIQA